MAEVVAEYNFGDEYFAIWAYKDADFERKGQATQQIQFNKEIAEELYVALGKFLHK